jgi:hypothetical protein
MVDGWFLWRECEIVAPVAVFYCAVFVVASKSICCMWMREHETARYESLDRSGSDLKMMLLGLQLPGSKNYPMVFNRCSEDTEAHIDCTLTAPTTAHCDEKHDFRSGWWCDRRTSSIQPTIFAD